MDHSECAFRLSLIYWNRDHCTVQLGPQWFQMTKFQQIYISFRFRRKGFTVKICQIVAWHKYDLSISRIFEFYFWRVFDIWLHRAAGAETPRAPPFTSNQNHPCSAQSYQLCPSQNKSNFFVASVKKLRKQKEKWGKSFTFKLVNAATKLELRWERLLKFNVLRKDYRFVGRKFVEIYLTF